MRIALTGNPNSGKTTMYNALTGRNERVGNWAGVTVEKKEHPIKKTYYDGEEQLIAVDLPGAYSMSPFTSEESITSSYVKKEHPDVIINIVDATNLSRSLFFTTQLLELGIPVVVALNKSDINEKKETKIDVETLSAKLKCPVIKTVSTSNEGLKAVVEAAAAHANQVQDAPYREGDIDLTDKKVVELADRKRFDFVNGIVAQVEKRKVFTKDKNSGDSIDAVLTKPWLGIPIFAVVMFLVLHCRRPGGSDREFPGLGGRAGVRRQPPAVRPAGRRHHRRRGRRGGLPAPGHGDVFPHRSAGGLRLYVPCGRGAGPHLQKSGPVRQVSDPLCHCHWLRHPRHYGLPYHPQRAGAPVYRYAGYVYALRG